MGGTFHVSRYCALPLFFYCYGHIRHLHSFPTRRSSDLSSCSCMFQAQSRPGRLEKMPHLCPYCPSARRFRSWTRSEEHTSELQSPMYLVCRLLLEKKKRIAKRAALTAPRRPTATLAAGI